MVKCYIDGVLEDTYSQMFVIYIDDVLANQMLHW